MKREIIIIDEELCTGCGDCIPGCPEGALQMIDGKARLVSDLFCDGLGACIGECPVNAISIEEREAEPYDEVTVMGNIVKQGEGTILAHLEHLREHNETEYLNIALAYLRENSISTPLGFNDIKEKKGRTGPARGCPGSMEQVLTHNDAEDKDASEIVLRSELTQWPVQLQLINPSAPYFKDADLLIAADCVPFSYADFHRKFLKDKKLIILCPKLDTTIEIYIDKLKEIFSSQNIRSVTIAHMEVPCCFGVGKIVQTAIEQAGVNIPVKEFNVAISGEIKG